MIGGGIAGLASATVLAERGVRVTVLERETFLGGRAGSWSDELADGTPFEMERGFHAFFRQYYNLRSLLRRIDPELSFLVPTEDYPLFGPDGAQESFSNLPKRAPWNLIKLVMRSPSIRMMDLFGINGPAAGAMLAYHPERTYERFDDVTAEQYLDSLRFPPKARRMLFDVFAHSFFNPEGAFSAGELIMMFHYYFLGNPEGIVFDVANGPFGRVIWDPLEAYLLRNGAEVRRGTTAVAVDREEDGWSVQIEGAPSLRADAVVTALPVPALQRLVAASDDLADPAWRRSIEQLGVTRPFSVWRLWMDRPANADRAPFAGTTGLGIVDNISLYEQLEDESRAWSDRTGGSIVEIHAYAVPEQMSEDAVKQDMLTQLHRLYPEFAEAKIIEERFLHRQDCPAFPPGSFAARPEVHTPWPGFTIAGDFVKTPFPTALMERATATGFMAANDILQAWGVRPEVLYSVPLTGLFAPRAPKMAALTPGVASPTPASGATRDAGHASESKRGDPEVELARPTALARPATPGTRAKRSDPEVEPTRSAALATGAVAHHDA